MTMALFQDDAYMRDATGIVMGSNGADAIWLDQSIFYATSGGQPHDTGHVEWHGGRAEIVNVTRQEGRILLHLGRDSQLPSEGTELSQNLDWGRRYRHMQIHTALHLLSVVVPLPVTGGAITEQKGRLDFNMPEAITDKTGIEDGINRLIELDCSVSYEWIDEAELERKPEMVKTMSVKPPVGAGRIRLVRIGTGADTIDLQPCGGTHVRSTGEIGPIRIGKIEKKGRMNRRINLIPA